MVTVVIPAYNEEKYIARCLESFEHQTTKEPFEVILVDNASTDKTKDIAEKFLHKFDLTILEEHKKGRGYARGLGFEKAKGDIILSTDSDGWVPENWIENMVRIFDDPQVIAVTGPVKVHDLGKIKSSLMNSTLPYVMYLYRLLAGSFWLTGSNFGIRKDIYTQSGGFAKAQGLEDIDLSVRVAKMGTITYKPIWIWTSGRRFQSTALGFGDYFMGFIHFFIYKKKKLYLPDRK